MRRRLLIHRYGENPACWLVGPGQEAVLAELDGPRNDRGEIMRCVTNRQINRLVRNALAAGIRVVFTPARPELPDPRAWLCDEG